VSLQHPGGSVSRHPHLEPDNGGYRTKDDVVRGRIKSEVDDPFAPLLIIDGKEANKTSEIASHNNDNSS
jgi:hypothetical protein